ncbi:Multidrug-efflux transporter MexB [Kluyvera cryocrescens]|uniref:Multidrug-efflux transporter MexB n=1 Tax=Kluyvera cryocrescens TaxID=580 RepID=A0A485AUK6_KLUCR|nr:Multidrug-efflux transporter MexB [Kluyvera cryocrescens]
MAAWISQDISDYVASNIQDPISRVDGVGDIDAYGSQYSMANLARSGQTQ